VSTRLRSRAWFDDPDHVDNMSLYLERMLNYGLTLDDFHATRVCENWHFRYGERRAADGGRNVVAEGEVY